MLVPAAREVLVPADLRESASWALGVDVISLSFDFGSNLGDMILVYVLDVINFLFEFGLHCDGFLWNKSEFLIGSIVD